MTGTDRAVVIGASVAGLASAAGLAARVGEVTVVERRGLPAPGRVESIAAHGGFPHVLLGGGAATLDRIVPGLSEDLFDRGAAGRLEPGAPRRGYWWAEGTVRHALPDLGVPTPMCSRALVESCLRDRVRAMANVRFEDGVVVRGLAGDRDRVAGVRIERDGDVEMLPADLVVDASGRGTRAPAWLSALGVPTPPVSQVEVGVTYTAVDVRRHPSDFDGALFAFVQNTADCARIGVALAAEGDRWKVVIGGYFGDAARPERDDMLRFAASMPDPTIAHLLENEWTSVPAQHRFPSSLRRHWERVRRLPAGFCAVGDSVASFNPLYGQGMSAAAMQAEALVSCFDRLGNHRPLPHAVARATARTVANPWQIATGADFVYPQTRGPKAPGTDVLNRYIAKVLVAATCDDEVNRALTRVQQLLAAPQSLLDPRIVLRVRRVARARRRQPIALEPRRPQVTSAA